MNPIPLLLADADTEEVLAAWRITDPTTLERIMIFGAIGLVTLLAVLWAVFLRRKRRRRRSHLRSPGPTGVPEAPKDEGSPAPEEKRRRHRRSRRRYRQRNPTLAETGGLPPIRPEGAPESEP